MGVVTEGVKHSMNPFDEIALEEVIKSYIIGESQNINLVNISCEKTNFFLT